MVLFKYIETHTMYNNCKMFTCKCSKRAEFVLKASSQSDHLHKMSAKKCPCQPLRTGNRIILGVLKIGEGNEGFSKQCSRVDIDNGGEIELVGEGIGVEQAVFDAHSSERVFGSGSKTLSTLSSDSQSSEEHFGETGFLNTEVT